MNCDDAFPDLHTLTKLDNNTRELHFWVVLGVAFPDLYTMKLDGAFLVLDACMVLGVAFQDPDTKKLDDAFQELDA